MPGKIKEKIIDSTLELIRESCGNIEEITTRAIAKRAGIGVGLVNYHFQTKENLITQCVQRIIGGVIAQASFNLSDIPTERERVIEVALQVYDFLFENAPVSRISILGDLHNYEPENNSIRSQRGLIKILDPSRSIEEKQFLAFLLVSVMQTAFLGFETCSRILDCDLQTPDGRRKFITKTVSVLFDGISG